MRLRYLSVSSSVIEGVKEGGNMLLGCAILSIPIIVLLRTLKILTMNQITAHLVISVTMAVLAYFGQFSEKLAPELKARIPEKSIVKYRTVLNDLTTFLILSWLLHPQILTLP